MHICIYAYAYMHMRIHMYAYTSGRSKPAGTLLMHQSHLGSRPAGLA